MLNRIAWFNEIDDEDHHLVGVHGKDFGALTKISVPLPEGFVITTHAFNEFFSENQLDLKIKQLISTVNVNHPDSLKQVSSHIKKYFIESDFTPSFKLDLSASYKKLGGTLSDIQVKIMPSPADHNRTSKHFIDNIRGEINLIDSIKEIWASNFTEMNIVHNHSFPNFSKALVVQKMIDPDKSGKIYTVDTENKDKESMVIKAVHGLLGNTLNLMSLPDYYMIKKNTAEIISKEVRPQFKMSKIKGSGTTLVDVPETLRDKQKLLDLEIKELIQIAKNIEKLKYFPQEIDWVIEKGKIFFVHAKPITTIN